MGNVEYRVVELRPNTDNRTLVVIPVYFDGTGRIISSADPYDASVDISGQTMQDIEARFQMVKQATYRPILQLADIPGADEYVDPAQREPLPASLIESLSSPGTIEHPSDPSPPIESCGSGDVRGGMNAAVFDQDFRPYFEAGPDPDRQHDEMWVDLGGEG